MHQLMSPSAHGNLPSIGVRAIKNVLLRCRACGFSMNKCADFAEVRVDQIKYWLENDKEFATEWDNSVNFLINSAMHKLTQLVFTGHNMIEIFEEDGDIKLIRKRNQDPTIRDMDLFLTRLERVMGKAGKEDRTEELVELLRDVAAANNAKSNADPVSSTTGC